MPRRRTAWPLLAVAGIAIAILLSGLLSSSAAAQEPPPEPTQTARGTLRYRAEDDERIPIEGAEIAIATADGEELGTATTDEDGQWEFEIPEAGSYRFELDTASLPDGVNPRQEGDEIRTVPFAPGDTKTILFPLISGETGSGGLPEGDTTFERATRLSVIGVQFGLAIAMAAIGLSLIFGTTGLVNFAHGELVTFGAMIAILFNNSWGVHLLLAAPIAVVIAGIAGGGLERFFWRPLRHRGTGLIAMLVISIGLGLLLRYLFLYQYGGFFRAYRQFNFQRSPLLEIGPVRLLPREAVIMALSLLALIGVSLFLQKTKHGKAIRAVADNPDLASASGIDVDRVILIVWVAGASLAALGGIFIGLSDLVDWLLGLRLLLLMFAGIILGGLGTAYGALVGSLIVGIFVQVSTVWVAPELKTVGALLILIVILLVRPQGILGQAERVG